MSMDGLFIHCHLVSSCRKPNGNSKPIRYAANGYLSKDDILQWVLLVRKGGPVMYKEACGPSAAMSGYPHSVSLAHQIFLGLKFELADSITDKSEHAITWLGPAHFRTISSLMAIFWRDLKDGKKNSKSKKAFEMPQLRNISARLELMAKHTGQSVETIEEDMGYGLRLYGEEAIQYGIADHILPCGKKKIRPQKKVTKEPDQSLEPKVSGNN